MEIVISIAAKIAEYTVAPIGRRLGYLCFYNTNAAELQTQNNRLGHAVGRLQRQVDDAKRNGGVIETDVEECLTNVDNITKEYETFRRDHEEQANIKCSVIGAKFPNLAPRYRLSRRAKKMAQNVDIQIREVEKFIPTDKEVSYYRRHQRTVDNEGYMEFEKREQIVKDLIEALKDPNTGKVGVWGMGGVGKTMLAKEVARRSKDKEELFTHVIFVTISQTPSLKSIRQDILEGLGMDQMNLENRRELEVYEARLQNRLSNEDRLLVIVDDVWNKFDLKEVGICFSDDKKGCKILVTSRDQHLLQSAMVVDRKFEVGGLLEHEAISLFHKSLGNQAKKLDDDDDFRHLATDIVRECGGLPIVITTVAGALRNKIKQVWMNALHDLRNSNPINIPGVHEKVYSSIKLSYDFLASDEAKELLLLCGLFPEDENMDVEADLCSYGIGLNVFHGVNMLKDARNRTITLVENLKDHSLLLDGTDAHPNCVKLHDVIRDIVIFIASKFGDGHGHRMHTIRNAAELEAYFDTGKSKDSKAISLYLVDKDLSTKALESPELKILKGKCSGNYMEYLRLGLQFFGGLDKLLVLDLQRVALEAFPPASSFSPPFPNLRTLRLNYCNLGNTTIWIGELKNLRILDLSYSDITELPTEVGNLSHLLSLRLNDCWMLKVIRQNVLARLTHLEDLELPFGFENWEKPDPDGVDNASVGELTNLPRLTNLILDVPDVNLFPKDMMFCEKLEKYDLRANLNRCSTTYMPLFVWIRKIKSTRRLELELSQSSALNEHDFIALLKRSDVLCLTGLKSVKSVAYELHDSGFPQLKHLALTSSAEIRCLVDNSYSHHHPQSSPSPSPSPPPAAFPILERLLLCGLSNLENIITNIHKEYQKHLITTMTTKETRTFGKLGEIEVWRCDRLRSVISLDNINPRQLKKIIVSNCKMLEEIITITTTHGRDRDHLPKHILEISHLRLERLPKLVQFTATTKSDDSDMPFFNGQVEFPKLESLQLELLYCRRIWSDQLPSPRLGFQSLTILEVDSCENLKGLIPSSMMETHFVNLKSLQLRRCKAMKEVAFTKEYSAQNARTLSSMGIKKISFPKLEDLQLCRLPNLERFCAWDCVDFPSLLTLEIDNCPKLRAFVISSMPTVETENLEIRRQLPDHQRSGGGGGGVEQQEHDDDMVIKNRSSSSREAKASSQNEYSRDIFFFKTSFQSLKTLKVMKLRGVTSLFSSSAVAESLSQLSQLCIGQCDSLRHVVVLSPNSDGHDDDDGGGVAAAAAGNTNGNNSSRNIVFSRLKIVMLDDLPNLTSFFSFSSSGNNNNNVVIEFPLLNKLAVGPCPKMTTFSHPANHIICPSLRDIIVYKSKEAHFWNKRVNLGAPGDIRFSYNCDYLGTPRDIRSHHLMWEGDINTTIQMLNLTNYNNTNTTTPEHESSRKLIN